MGDKLDAIDLGIASNGDSLAALAIGGGDSHTCIILVSSGGQ